MNERIKQLVKQAGGHFSTHNLMSNPVQHRESIELWDNNIDMFAELIVRECADIAREIGNNTEPDDFALDRCYEIEDQIMKHFGVEE